MPFFVFIHPALGALVLLLGLVNTYLGVSRAMIARGRGSRLFHFNRGVHINLGRGFVALLFVAFPLGLSGMAEAGKGLFSTPHSFLGVLLLAVFGTGASLAFYILKGKPEYIRDHGRIMLLGVALLFLQLGGGIANLRLLGII